MSKVILPSEITSESNTSIHGINLSHSLGSILNVSRSQFLHRLSHLFGVSEESFLRCTDAVMDCLVGNLHKIICWPKPNEFASVASEFDKIGRYFPNVIGAIDWRLN